MWWLIRTGVLAYGAGYFGGLASAGFVAAAAVTAFPWGHADDFDDAFPVGLAIWFVFGCAAILASVFMGGGPVPAVLAFLSACAGAIVPSYEREAPAPEPFKPLYSEGVARAAAAVPRWLMLSLLLGSFGALLAYGFYLDHVR